MSKSSEWILSALAVVILCASSWAIVREISSRDGLPSNEPGTHGGEVDRVAKLVPENGWFPAQKDPIFDWETGVEGWSVEQTSLPASSGFEYTGVPDAQRDGETSDEENRPVNSPEYESSKNPERQLKTNKEFKAHGDKSLAIPVNFPDAATIRCAAMPTLAGIRQISYDVYVPTQVPGYVGSIFYLQDKDGRWFQARSHRRLLPGQWNTVTADLRAGSPDIEPLGHLGRWDENQASQVRTIGLTLYGQSEFSGTLYVDNFRGFMRAERFKKMMASSGLENSTALKPGSHEEELKNALPLAKEKKAEPLQLLSLRTLPVAKQSDSQTQNLPEAGLYTPFTISFNLNREISNPFDPSQCDIRAEVTSPSGKKYETFGFWYQDFEMKDRFASEELTPVGNPEWRVRVAPREKGVHKVTLKISLQGADKNKDATNFLELPPMEFKGVESTTKGYIHVCKEDTRYFEHESGEFFYPIGMNIHSPIDLRCWDMVFSRAEPPLFRGLKMYEDFFAKMQKNGSNAAEVWMASWWLGIEWTKQWKNFHGVGRYSMENAWKLDKLLEMAAQRGIYLHLALDNHGKFSTWCDPEWNTNPYQSSEFGDKYCNSPTEYFSRDDLREYHKRRLRYIAARFGSSPNIFGFELCSEFDLAGDQRREFHRSELGREWSSVMMNYLRATDIYGHPITNHFAGFYERVDRELTDTPVYDYIVTDAYRGDRGYFNIAMNQSPALTPANKPFLITEYGGEWSGTNHARLEADLHCGMWTHWVTNAGGAPFLWWYDFVDQKDLYFHFNAFSKYIAGEEKRKLKGDSEYINCGAPNMDVRAIAFRWPTGAYVFGFERNAMEELPEPGDRPLVKGFFADVPGLEAGKYKVEFWDTYKGGMVKSEEATVTAGQNLRLKYPDFYCDMAVKIKKQ